MSAPNSRLGPILRGLSVLSALALLSLYVVQAQQAQNEPDKKKPAMAPGSKALAPETSKEVFASSSKSGIVFKPSPSPGARSAAAPTPTPAPAVTTTPRPSVTPTPAPSK